MEISRTLELIGRFLVHVVAEAVTFVVIFLVAVGLSKFADWVEWLNVLPALFIYVLRFVEYLLFAVDILGFVWALIIEFWRLVTQIWAMRSDP